MSPISQLPNMVNAPVSDANDQMDVDFIVVQAQEQLQPVLKAREKEWKERIWLEEDWEAWKEEWSSVLASDKAVTEKVLEKMAKEMWGIFCQVSANFLQF